jgi:hypothetical protein
VTAGQGVVLILGSAVVVGAADRLFNPVADTEAYPLGFAELD